MATIAAMLLAPGNEITQLDVDDLPNEEDALALAAALRHENNQVTNLELFDKQTSARAICAIVASLKYKENKVKRLKQFSLFEIKFDDECLASLVESLKHPMNKLMVLELVGLKPEGGGLARSISEALMHANNHIAELRFEDCDIGDEGACQVASALTHENNRVVHLILESNQLGDASMLALANTITHRNTRMWGIDLRRNTFSEQACDTLARAILHPNSEIRYIRMWSRPRVIEDAMDNASTFRQFFVLLSARQVRHVGAQSALRRLPCELVRLLTQMLRVEGRDY